MSEELLTNIAVIGTGAMGSLFAGQLSSNAAVTIVGSWQKQMSAIEEAGLVLIDMEGNQTNHALAVGGYDSVEGPYQYVIILVKGWQTEHAAKTAREILASNGLALTLQNGLGHHGILADLVGESHSALGVTSEGAMIAGPGRIQHTGIGVTHLGTTPATEERLTKMASLLRRSGFETRLAADLDGLVWGKLAVNSGINPLTALLQVRNGFLSTDEIARSMMCRAAEETAALAKVQGIRLPYVSASERITAVAKATAANRSSMAQDIARGAPTEIESINGMVVQIASELGLEVTVNRVLYQLVKDQIATGDWRSEIGKLPGGIRDQFMYLANLGNHS